MGAPEVRYPRDIAELRAWLMGQWKPSSSFSQRMQAAYGTHDPDVRPYYVSEYEALQGATLWWVSADMVDLLLATASSVPDDVMYSDLPVPSNSGLVVLEKSWVGTDAKSLDSPVVVDALLWSQNLIKPNKNFMQSFTIATYRHLDFGEGLNEVETKQATALDAWSHGTPHFINRVKNGARTEASYVLTGHSWIPLGRSNWPIKDRIDFRPWEQPDHTYRSFVEDRKILTALFTLLRQQGIARTEVIPLDRSTQRQSLRAGVNRENTYSVQVVTLRRLQRTERDASADPKKVDWSHRWMVDGHYRWQQVGKGRCDRRLTFVSPHIKGPEDKPFEPPTRVNAWRR